jgi:hypothetical protein
VPGRSGALSTNDRCFQVGLVSSRAWFIARLVHRREADAEVYRDPLASG